MVIEVKLAANSDRRSVFTQVLGYASHLFRLLNPQLPGQARGMLTIWNARGAFISPQRPVIEAEAPQTLARLDERFPTAIRQNNSLTSPVDQEILDLLKDAYTEAAQRRSRPAE